MGPDPSQTTRSRAQRGALFFILAGVMAAVLVGGFSLNLAMDRASFDVPLAYHIRAFVFFGWIVLFLTQT